MVTRRERVRGAPRRIAPVDERPSPRASARAPRRIAPSTSALLRHVRVGAPLRSSQASSSRRVEIWRSLRPTAEHLAPRVVSLRARRDCAHAGGAANPWGGAAGTQASKGDTDRAKRHVAPRLHPSEPRGAVFRERGAPEARRRDVRGRRVPVEGRGLSARRRDGPRRGAADRLRLLEREQGRARAEEVRRQGVPEGGDRGRLSRDPEGGIRAGLGARARGQGRAISKRHLEPRRVFGRRRGDGRAAPAGLGRAPAPRRRGLRAADDAVR
mmetsp:Transcript_3827/g.11522  ORF Transcript_3827/g.11522 Transcript_3827/m.11522 type:complete len:270 (-) Transcript_3827:307-1116(-)